MPHSITTNHMNRIFPFEFFYELSEKIKNEYILNNPAFLPKNKLELTKEKQKEIWDKSRNEELIKTLHGQNILELDPFGEVLLLDLCCGVKDVSTLIGDSTESDDNKAKKSQVPLSILICQLYDNNNLPIFAKDVQEKTISQIPEVLYDDPNLMISVISFDNENGEAQTGIISIPKEIEKKIFEDVK